jgi:excisionase family DNA binding protein
MTALVWNVAEAAEKLGISRAHIYKFIQTGELRSLKIGSRRMILPADVEDFLARSRDAQVTGDR